MNSKSYLYNVCRNLVRYANRWLRRHPDIQVKGAETIELSGASAPDVKHTASSHHAAKYQHSRFWALRYTRSQSVWSLPYACSVHKSHYSLVLKFLFIKGFDHFPIKFWKKTGNEQVAVELYIFICLCYVGFGWNLSNLGMRAQFGNWVTST